VKVNPNDSKHAFMYVSVSKQSLMTIADVKVTPGQRCVYATYMSPSLMFN